MAGSPPGSHVEYLGFAAKPQAREYTLRVKRGDAFHDFTLAIPNEAFLSRRVRYQDAPELCFLKLQHELLVCTDGGLPSASLSITEADLDAYRTSHAPRAPQRRPKPAPTEA